VLGKLLGLEQHNLNHNQLNIVVGVGHIIGGAVVMDGGLDTMDIMMSHVGGDGGTTAGGGVVLQLQLQPQLQQKLVINKEVELDLN